MHFRNIWTSSKGSYYNEQDKGGSEMKAKTIVILVLIGLFLIILIQNTQVVTLRLLFWKIGMSQIIFVPVIMLIGFVIGYLVAKATGGTHSKGEHKKEV